MKGGLASALDDVDVAVITPGHPELDREAVVGGAPRVVQVRGVTAQVEAAIPVRL